MKTPELFKEYLWLVKTIYDSHGITLAEINSKWKSSVMGDGNEMSRTTFKRHKASIEEMFGIIIECDVNNGYKYSISNRSVLESDTVQNWMMSTLTVNNVISRSMSMQDRILLEEIPSGGMYLEALLDAMKTCHVAEISYQRFGQDESRTISIEPYALKLFGQRWYVLAHSEHHDLAVYALDRMKEIRITDVTFVPKEDFDARRYFSECYGVIAGDGTQVAKITLRAYGQERYYLDSLPLHHTQKLVQTTEEYNVYEYHLRPTYDFIQAIMANAADIEVIEPLSLRTSIKELLTKSLSRY